MATSADILFDASSIEEVKASVLGLIPIFDRVAAATRGSSQRVARERVTAETSANKEIAKEADKSAKDQERLARDSARERERIAQAASRAELNFIKAGQRAIADAERERTRIAEDESRRRQRIAEQEAAAISRRARTFGSTMGGAAGRVMGMAGRVAGIAGAIGGGYTLANALGSGIEQEKIAGQLVRSSSEKGGLSGANVQAAAGAAAIATGGTTTDNLQGIDRFIRETGNLKVGVDMVKDLARYSASSGASMDELGTTSGMVFSHMKGDVGETKEVLRALIAQSKMGAIDARDIAGYGGRLVGASDLFEGKTSDNIQTFGALTQIAKRRGGKIDAAEATEASARIFGEVSMHADDFKELLGHDVRGASGKMMPVEDILLETLVKTKGDITAIPRLFGRQAGGVETGLATAFLEGSGGKTDAASLERGRAFAASEIQSFRKPMSEGEVDADVAARSKEVSAQMNNAMTEFNRAVNEKLMPVMPQLVDNFTKLIPYIERFLNFLVSEPWKGLGAVVGTALALELSKSVVTGAVTGVFTSLAEKVLKLFTTTTAATAVVNAGVVNVNSASNGTKVVEDIAKNGGGALAAAAGYAGAAIQGGFIVAAGAHEYGVSQETAKAKANYQDIVNMPSGTDEEKRAKIEKLEAAKKMATDVDAASAPSSAFSANARFGRTAGGLAADTNPAGAEMHRHVGDITEQLAALKAALDNAPETVAAFVDSMKGQGGSLHAGEPSARVTNPEQ